MCTYICSKCKIAVIITEKKEVIKPCKCNAPIIANISAKAKGVGKTKK